MTFVVDASVALKWVLDEPGRDAADRLLDENLIAPSLWLVEAANALWKRTERGEISADRTRSLLAALMEAPVDTRPVEDDLAAACDLANRLNHPVYDCLYLAMALRSNSQVITADRRFKHAADLAGLAGLVQVLSED